MYAKLSIVFIFVCFYCPSRALISFEIMFFTIFLFLQKINHFAENNARICTYFKQEPLLRMHNINSQNNHHTLQCRDNTLTVLILSYFHEFLIPNCRQYLFIISLILYSIFPNCLLLKKKNILTERTIFP